MADVETPLERRRRLNRDRVRRYRNRVRDERLNNTRQQVAAANGRTVELHYCGPMNLKCQFCNALHFEFEKPSDGKFNLCCHKGRVRLIPRQRFPASLQSKMSNPHDPDYKNFKENIRQYNSSISFASMGAELAGNSPGHGPYCFRVQGQFYHRTSHLHPEEGQQRKYAQLYVLDTTQAVQERLNNDCNENCLPHILRELDEIMRENPFAQAYKMLSEVEHEQQEHARLNNLPMPRVNMVLRRDRHSDQRRYNLPTSNEVAMVFQNDDGEPPFERDIRVYPQNSEQPYLNLNILSPNLDPMTYPIFFPHGEPGWQPQLLYNPYPGASVGIRTKCSMLQYKSALFAVREDEFNPILHGGKLTQQYAVDSYLQVEANNLNYIRFNQTKLRAEEYSGLLDYIERGVANVGVQAGRAVILPSSFQGSPRNMRERYNDAMAIVTKLGKPDIFCTFTCNPKWREITENLNPGQVASDRPDLVARIFHIKLNALMKDITDGEIFGTTLGYVHSIEFQKRGLPHAHILLILAEPYKFREPSQVDRLIKAELPDPITDPHLFEIVKRHMIHGPCGNLNPRSPCMVDGKCSKDFPKQFQQTTQVNANGYPLYQRRETSNVLVRGKPVDNRFVVPYNHFLLQKYDAHINVEACTSIKSVKYIYKYIYKGYDCANLEIRHMNDEQNVLVHDEIANHVDARYVSAPEAMWRLSEFNMHSKSHKIIRLAVHLPCKQIVYFQSGQENNAVQRTRNRDTHLTAWFKLCLIDEQARQYFYHEIPYHYVYKNGSWERRQQIDEKIIPRLYTVSPNDIERFSLRLLLLHVPGATSFEYLLTYNTVTYPTFQEAARARQLLADDQEWERCLEEAATTKMPRHLRQTFAFICIFCSPANALSLWEKFLADMCEDFRLNFSGEEALNMALCEIQDILMVHGKKCSDFLLPNPQNLQQQRIFMPTFDPISEAAEATAKIATLNTQQRQVFNTVRSALDSPLITQRCFYLDGPGGSGKTYIYNTLMCFVRGQNQVVLPYATTGISAILLKSGRTVHSGFKLPVPITETSTSSMKVSSPEAHVLRVAKLIIIDEATMLTSHALRCIDKLLREIMCDESPFGGKVILLGGDFRQTLPVVPRGNRIKIVEACLKSSPLWKHFVHLQLYENMRSEGQNNFNTWLLDIGEGKTPVIPNLEQDIIEIPQSMICNESIIPEIYGNRLNIETVQNFASKVILTTKNAHAMNINNKVLNLIPGESKTYYSVDSVVLDDTGNEINYPPEFLHAQTPSGMPPHKITLKIGAIIMLIRNLNPKQGLCNGTRLIIENLHTHFIDVKVLTGTNKGDRAFIPRIDLAPSETTLPFILKRRQFPVIMAFAITICKSQGQTFDSVGIYLEEPVFGHGMLYVALSRCKNERNVKVFINPTEKQGALLHDSRIFTKNMVYPEVL